MQDVVKALILLDGDVTLTAEKMQLPPEAVWEQFLNEEDDIAPLIRKVMLLGTLTDWAEVRDASKVDELGAYELVKARQMLTSDLVALMDAGKPLKKDGDFNQQNNFNFGDATPTERLRAALDGIPSRTNSNGHSAGA